MSLRQISYLGQTGTTEPYATIGEVWNIVRQKCLEIPGMTEAQCNGLLGTQPIYFPPTCKQGVPWWVYIGVGFVLGKFI